MSADQSNTIQVSLHSGQSLTLSVSQSNTIQVSIASAQSSTPSLDQSNTIKVSASSTGFGQTMFTGFPWTTSLNNNGVEFNQTTPSVSVSLTLNYPHWAAAGHPRDGSNGSGGT